jgi:multidrug efflux pump subunit AcrA (membrane-fusion protein)
VRGCAVLRDGNNLLILTESTLKTWLELQRQLIAGLQLAYVALHGDDLPAHGLAVLYPDEAVASDELALAARLAARSEAPVTGTAPGRNGEPAALRVAYPLRLGNEAHGAIVVEVNGDPEQQRQIIRLLKWGETWLKLALQRSEKQVSDAPTAALIREGLAQSGADDTVTAVLARLPELTGCTRAALGESNDGRVQLVGISNVAEPAKRNDRVRLIERAMREALDAEACCYWPGDDDTAVEQQNLADKAGLTAVCSVPIGTGLPRPLVFTFEYDGGAHWSGQSPQRCSDAAALIAPLVAFKQERDRSWWVRWYALMAEGIGSLTQRAGAGKRLAWMTVALVIIAFGLSTGSYRVSAPAVVEGAVQRALVAPFDAFIAEAPVRAGQTVAVGDLLARLDDRDLQNDRRRIRAEQNELVDQHRQAVATLDHAGARVLDAQLAQNRARLALLDERLARTELRAPLEGIVISGDWTRSLGAPVTRGDLLFEIAPLDQYRVAIQVSDRDVVQIADGQIGELVLAALPRQPVQLKVTEIATLSPEDVADPGFRVEAELVGEIPALRPGMEGVAKVTVGERRRWWIWTHPLTDWLRLQWWRWWP